MYFDILHQIMLHVDDYTLKSFALTCQDLYKLSHQQLFWIEKFNNNHLPFINTNSDTLLQYINKYNYISHLKLLVKKILLINDIEKETHITNGYIHIHLNDNIKNKIQPILPVHLINDLDNQRLYICQQNDDYYLLHYKWIDYIEFEEIIKMNDIVYFMIQLLYHNVHFQNYGLNFILDDIKSHDFDDLLFYHQRQLLWKTLNYLDQRGFIKI